MECLVRSWIQLRDGEKTRRTKKVDAMKYVKGAACLIGCTVAKWEQEQRTTSLRLKVTRACMKRVMGMKYSRGRSHKLSVPAGQAQCFHSKQQLLLSTLEYFLNSTI
jgi:hypothetical protein